MTGEKYLIATSDISFHITIRNILNPCGYIHGGNSDNGVSLLRLVRSFNPDFIIVDTNMHWRELKQTIETIDEEMLCFCIIIGEYISEDINNLIDNSMVISFCYKPLTKEMLTHTVEMASISFKRLTKLDKKLKETTENFESKKLVDRAKRILMDQKRIEENEAYTIIRKKSMNLRAPMKQVAEDIILTYKLKNKDRN